VHGVNGISSNGANLQFTTGSGPDTVVPVIVSVSPPNGSTNVGDNASIRLLFKPMNPLTINSNTVQLSFGGGTVIPTSMSFRGRGVLPAQGAVLGEREKLRRLRRRVEGVDTSPVEDASCRRSAAENFGREFFTRAKFNSGSVDVFASVKAPKINKDQRLATVRPQLVQPQSIAAYTIQ
jgi:hypothetical protein